MASLMRARKDGETARVGFVELFFDLVFVFAITQISHTLVAHLTWLGALQAAMLLAAVWWSWIDTSWITNWLDPERTPVRVMLFVLMAAGLLMSTSLPEAFGDKGLWFAAAFATIQVGRSLFSLWAMRDDDTLRRNFQRISVWALAGAGLWISGGLADGQDRLVWWAVALVAEFAGPALFFRVPGLGRSHLSDWAVDGGHLAERVGLFIIICLGESLLVTGGTFSGSVWSPPVVAAFVTAFVGTLAMWWIYFSASHEAAAEVIAGTENSGRLARLAYTYCPFLIVAGIVVTAVGDELSLGHPLGPVKTATAVVLIGGPLLFMVGALVTKWAVFERWSASRLAGAVALAALWPVVPFVTPVGLAGLATGVLVLVAGWETLSLRRQGRKRRASGAG